MRKKLLILGVFSFLYSVNAQVLTYVGQGGAAYVQKDALVYSGGTVVTVGDGRVENSGNVMINGGGFYTYLADGVTDKTTGGNFILKLTDLTNYSTYGQLYITGVAQGAIKGIVDKEFRNVKHGTYQQIALPFYQKQLSTLNTELGKTFSNTRWSQNEILTWNNARVRSDGLSTASTTPKNTAYYMLGSSSLDTSSQTFTLRGVPYADGITETLKDAGAALIFGAGGSIRNYYGETYNSYLQDAFDYSSNLWTGNYGKNIYQFGNPFLTNLDLSRIGYIESATSDGNAIANIRGIRYDPGTVNTDSNGSTYSTGAKYITFTSGQAPTVPVGDIDNLVIKPMQTFVIKLADNVSAPVLNFNTLRRFNYTARADGTNYDVTANRAASKSTSNSGTVKQLAVIGLNQQGTEIGRTYYVVYPDAITGHSSQPKTQVVATSTDIIGTYEESVNGGYDDNYINTYWLYINEANEKDFLGKQVPLVLYNKDIKSLKFQILENTAPIQDGSVNLSTGIGFYYKPSNGSVAEIKQNAIIPVNTSEYGLYYGKPNGTLAVDDIAKPSRTVVAYNKAIESYIVHFDPDWKTADITVHDMNGRLILSKKKVKTDTDFVIELSNSLNAAYIVTAISDKGERVNKKIVK